MSESEARKPVLQMRLKFLDGEEFILQIPLDRPEEDRKAMRKLLEDTLMGWDRAYDPQPCERCGGSGDSRDAPKEVKR